MFQKALLTLDRSPFSAEAIPRVADVTKTEVVVLEVLDSVADILGRSGPVAEVPAELAERITQSERAAVQQQLDAAAQQLRDLGIAQVSTAVREGRAGPEIVKLAEEEGCDVVVMSTHGRTGLMHLLMGSVAEAVVRRAPCPVLTLRVTSESAKP